MAARQDRLHDGNLGAQLLKLEQAGYVSVEKNSCFASRRRYTASRRLDAKRSPNTYGR